MANNWADEIWEKKQKKRRAVQGESVTDRGGDWALDNYNRIKSGDISLLSENKKTSSIDRNYVNRLTTYAANPRKNEGSAQEYYDYLRTNESEIRDYLGVGSYELAARRLLDEIARQKKTERLKETVGENVVGTGASAAMSAGTGSAAMTTEKAIRGTESDLYALTQRKTALTRERARLDDMVGQYDQSDTELWDDWHERSNAINEALAKLNSQISTAESNARLGQYDKLRGNADFEEYAQKGAELENPEYSFWNTGLLTKREYANPVMAVRQSSENFQEDILSKSLNKLFNYGQKYGLSDAVYMTSDEVNMYNYLLAKDKENGTRKAEDYYETLKPELQQRNAQNYVNGAESFVSENTGNAILGSVATVVRSPMNIVGYLDALQQKAVTGEINPNSLVQAQTKANLGVRGTVATNIQQDVTQRTGNQFAGEAASFLYQTGMSIADSAYNAAITGGNAGVSAVLMSGSAATSAMNDALEQGANERQALAIGGAAGIFESLFEYVSLDKLVKMSSPAARGSAVLNVLKQMGIEASEEAATEIANIAVDYALMGDASQYRKMSPAQIAWQVTKAAFGGGLSGGVMGGGAQLVSGMRARAIGSDIRQQGLAESVMQDAANSGDGQLASLAQSMEQGKAKQSSRNLGRLYAGMVENGTGMPSTEAALREAAYQMAAQQEEQTVDMPAKQQDTLQPPETSRPAQTADTQAKQQEKPAQNASNAAESGAEQQTGNPSGRSAESPSAARSARRDSAVSLVDDERITAAGIDAVEDGTVYVRSEDGGVLALGDVEFSNPDVAAVYQDAAQYDTDAAQKYVSAYDGTATPEQYRQGFAAVYRAARSGLSYEQALGSLPAQAYLTPDQRITAYAAGQKTASAVTRQAEMTPDFVGQTQKTTSNAAVQNVKKTYRTGLNREYVKASLNDTARENLRKHREQLHAVDVMAKKYGRKVVLVDTLEGKTISGMKITEAVNGAYDGTTGTIYLAADAQDGAFAYVAMHELVHSIKAESTEGYAALEQAVFDALKNSGEDVQALVQYQMDKFGYSEAAAREEVVANTAPTVLTDEQFVQDLYNSERSLFERIRAFIADLLETFRELTQSGSWKQDTALARDVEAVRKIAEAFDPAARAPSSGIQFGDMAKYSQKDQEIIREYQSAVDENLRVIAQEYRDNPQKEFGRHKIADVSARMAADIKRITDVDVSGFSVWIDKSTFQHIENRHGRNGSQDHSMANLNDVARMGYVIENYDEIKHVLDQKGQPVFSARYRNRDGAFSPLVLLKKKINGTYFLSEAVVDSKWRKLWVETAYINKKGYYAGRDNALDEDPRVTSETHAASLPSSSVAENEAIVNETEAQQRNEFSDKNLQFSVRDEDPPKKTILGYKVFVVFENKPGELYPPMVANPGGEATPVGVWLNADAAPRAADSKTGRMQVQAGGKGTQASKQQLAYRPGWHLGDLPMATQFARMNPDTGKKELFPANFVWAECDCAADIDYQDEAMSYGYNKNGKFQHSLAGLPRLPREADGTAGYYRYRTNPRPDTVPWIITGAMKVHRILDDAETDAILRDAGVEPMARQGGPIDLEKYGFKRGVVDEISQTLKPKNGLKLSVRDQFATDYDQWANNGRDDNAIIEVGTTPDVLQDLGARKKKTVMQGASINHAMKGHPEMTDALMKQVPDALENPVIVLKSRVAPNTNNPGDRPQTVVVYGDLTDSNGYPILMAVNMKFSTPGRPTEVEDVQLIKNAYAKGRGLAGQVENSDVLYLNEDKERTNKWLVDRRLQLPLISAHYGSIGSIAETDDEVKITGVPYKELVGGIKFSVKDVTPEDTQRLEKENARLKAALENARAQLRLTGGNQVSAQAVEKLARKIVRDTHSRYDAAALAGDLRQIYTYAATAENSEEALREIDDVGIGLAKKVLRESEQMDTTVSDQLTGLKDYLRNTGLSLNEDQKAEAAAMYGSYNDFRRQVFGTIKLTRDGVPLDVAWGELHDAYPWLFDADGTDMLESLVHAAELTRPQLVNPYGYNLDEAAADLWLTMQQEYANLPVNRTYADRQKARLDALRTEQAENLRRMRQEAKDRYEERLKAVKAENRAKRAELSEQYKKAVEDVKTAERMAEGKLHARERQRAQEQLQAAKQRAKELARQHQLLANEKLAQQQAEFREWKRADRADRKERTAAEKYRTRILANAKTLAGWLEKPTDDKHVPESLRRAVSGVLETIELGNGARKTKKAEAWRERLMDLAVEMDRIDNAPDEGTYLDVDPDLTQRIRDFVSGTRNLQYIDLMSAEQLRDLDYILQVTKRTVTYANRLRANAQYQQISALGEASIKEMDGKKAKPRMNAAVGKLDQFFNIQQLDSFAFFDELGGAATSVLQELRDGFDVKVRRVQRAVEYVQPFLEDVDVRKLSGKGAQIREFTVEDGTLRMTTAQIMELYELLKREQARGHIFGSGIRVADISRGKLRPEVVQLDPVRITAEEAERITGTLTDAQKQLADRLAWFLGNECAAWGNQTSQRMYGYKKFTEKNYYPIKTDANFTQTSDKNDKGQNGSLSALKNLGMTKAVVKGADNPLIVGDIFDTFAQHVDDMASYNGMMIPLSDAMKWFNYRARTDDMKVRSVKRSMERRAGRHAQGYFTTLIKNLNGINDRGERIGIMDTLTNHAKAAAIGANLRVVLQQPTAYARAAAVINPKYLLKALAHLPDVRGAKQNSAIAQWKSWGFYDISIGKSMRGLLFDDGSVLDNVKEWSMAPAGLADEVTWGTLFNACRLEAQEQHPGASQQEIDAAAGRRLSEIVDRTQVVDSPFHKSQIMRSKDGLTRMYTAFMAEPTKSYNLLRTALSRAIERKDKESMLGFVRTSVVFLATSAFTSAFAAVADMLRDDDKTKTLIEKYLAALKANMADNANPLALIPVVKDILSLLEGYDVSRLDLQAADKLINTGRIWIKQLSAETGEKPYTNWYMAYQTAQALSSVTGIPAGNLMRTVSSVANLFGADLRSKSSSAAASQKYEELYNAILKEDQGYIDRLNTYLQQDKEKSPKDIDSGVAKVLMERDERIAEAYALRQAGDVKGLEALRKEIAEVFGEEIVDRAINLYANTQESDEEKDMNEELSAPLYDYDDMATVARLAFESGETEDLAAVVEEIKRDSSAQDPDETVRNKAVALFKPEYLERLDAGDTAGTARMKQVLMKVYGLESDTIDAWRTSQRRDELYALIDAGSAREANSMIVQLRSLGRDNDSVRDSVRAHYKPLVVEAWNSGDLTTYKVLVNTLKNLNLYDAKGKLYFTDERILSWLED